MITRVEKYVVKQNKIGAFKTIISEIIEESRKEIGCLSYELNEDEEKRNVFTLVEKWESEEYIKLHNNSIHIKFLMPQIDKYKEDLEALEVAI